MIGLRRTPCPKTLKSSLISWFDDDRISPAKWVIFGLLKIGGCRGCQFWVYLDIIWLYMTQNPDSKSPGYISPCHPIAISSFQPGLLQEPHGCPGGSTQDLRLGNGWICVKGPCQQGHDQIPQLRMCPHCSHAADRWCVQNAGWDLSQSRCSRCVMTVTRPVG